MNTWLYVRIALVLTSGIGTLFAPVGPRAVPPIGWEALLAIFVFCPVALTLVLGLQVLNPRSAKNWRRPSWSINPFNFREPIQFFHLGAYVCLAQGVAIIIRLATSSVPFYVEALVPLVMACGVLVGLQVVMFVFRSKVVHDK